MIIVTEHAKERCRERLGLKPEATQRMADKIYKLGLTQDQAYGELQNFLKKYDESLDLRVYGEFLFLYDEERLVTAYKLPPYYAKQAIAQRAERDAKMESMTITTIKSGQEPKQFNVPTVKTVMEAKPSLDRNNIAKKLFEDLALKHNLTRKELAQKLDVSLAVVNDLLDGKSKFLGPIITSLIGLDKNIADAAEAIHKEAEQSRLKNSKKVKLQEQMMNLRQQMRNLERELQGLN